jgi:hypothetical protein
VVLAEPFWANERTRLAAERLIDLQVGPATGADFGERNRLRLAHAKAGYRLLQHAVCEIAEVNS